MLTFSVAQAQGLTRESRIHSIDQEYGFIRYENGRVVFLDESPALLALTSAHFKSMQTLELDELASTYEPTVLNGFQDVKKLFDNLNKNYRRVSECSDRAHIWAHDMYETQGIKSMKAFAFLTASYINRNRAKWWFHVAPMIKTHDSAFILDYQFMDKPVTVKEWTDLMVSSKRNCKLTTKFSEYDVNPQTEDCYIMFESMYYRLPGDIHRQETHNQFKNDFNAYEVQSSRRAAFPISSSNTTQYVAVLRPLNSHANGFIPYGRAEFEFTNKTLKAKTYLDDDQSVTHIQNVYMGEKCPTMDLDTNLDGFIDADEAATVTKEILISLDDPKGKSFTYSKSFSLSSMNLKGKVVMIHGTLNTGRVPDTVSKIAGRPAHLSVPIACGIIGDP